MRVSVPSLWPVLSSTGIHKDTETSAGSVAVHGYPGCDLHRRHVITPPTEQGVAENLCSSGRPTGKAGLSGEKGEVLSHSLQTSNLSWSCPGLHYNAPVPPSTKTYLHRGHLPSPPCSGEWLSEDSVHVNWTNEPCITNGDLGCSTSLQRSSTTILASSVTTWAGKESDSPLNLPGTQRPRVVGLGKQLPSEWLPNSASTHQSHSLERCLEKGLGCNLPGDFHRGPLECGRGAVAHQCLGVTSSNTGSESTSAVPRVSTSSAQTHSLENRQHHSGGVHQQERGHALHCSDYTSPSIVSSSLDSRSITDSSAYSRHSKCGSRHSLQADRDQNRMDIGQEELPVHLSEILHARSRPLCIPFKPPSTQVCLEVPRSEGSGCGCISLELDKMELSHPASGSPSASGTEEDQRGSSNCRPPNCPELDQTAMVSRPHSDAGGSPTAATPAPISVVSAISANSIPSSMEVPSSDSLATIRDRYQATGLSKEVVDILSASWGTATQKRYSAPWRAWVRWCSQRGSCPISAPVAEVLAFLASLVTQGKLEYRTIALYRSPISQAHDSVGSTQLGSLPVVARFMKGVFKIKPPKPRYCSTWNVKTALSFLESLEPLKELTLKQLFYKTVLLLALTSAARAHELSAFDLTYSLGKEGSWEFSLPTHVKNSRPGHPARKFIFMAFPENPKICVIRSLIAYVDRTKGLRKSTQLLVSFISTHKAISSQSVSRWLSRALRMAGIELKYTGHSTRGASTSAAAAAGLSADLILEAADWASVQTFERFYHRESSAGAFARAVLNG